ncbi:tyrosine-type recombinase/integrase [uncultured Thiodictyon sp.]|uniref:tyrosine-type recombinase/integrase n=1 Tax=uncultured Thiodictyon sp. TaxID=1846217 RepID=UPI0025F33DF2|nr:tyrosine-type recombinase/integrase [uncultured Thiodictyon sp.]
MPATDAVDLHEKPKNFLTEAEVERFLQAAKAGRHGVRDHSMMLLTYRHGLRETELCRLTVAALDLESARLWVERLKGSLSTHHPLDGEELRAIRRYLRIRDSRLPWLFVSERGGPFTRQGVYYLVRRIGERAWLGKVHPHMLRHTCGYALANKGHDLRTIQDYLGHRDPKHTAIYTRTAAKRFENLWR